MEPQPRATETDQGVVSSTITKTKTEGQRIHSPWSNPINIFQLLFAFRLLCALTSHTFFQPDEYYQALEPAWQLTFGQQSAAWITWEWRQHLRSAVHPALFALVYKIADSTCRILAISPSSHANVLVAAPKVLQAFFATTVDYYTWQLGRKAYGEDTVQSWMPLVLTVTSPWNWFCSTRTFSNCLETTLTVVALNWWPWDWTAPSHEQKDDKFVKTHAVQLFNLRKALSCAATATVLRPTNVLIWATIAVYTLVKTYTDVGQVGGPTSDASAISKQRGHTLWSRSLVLFRETTLCGGAILAVSAVIDKLFYGSWVFPPYNFLYFNVFQSIAIFYGNNNWQFYFSVGYITLLTTSFPFCIPALIGVLYGFPIKDLPKRSQSILTALALSCLTLPAVLSLLSHKEARFIYPILPCFNIIMAIPTSSLSLAFTRRSISAAHIDSERLKKRLIIIGLVPLSILIAYYMTQVHNSGLIALPEYLRHEFETHYLFQSTIPDQSHQTQGQNMTVAFLMPCHSVPWRSHLQYPATQHQPGIQAWALTCEPPIHLTNATEKATYLDEADIFYENPKAWIRRNMARTLPSSPSSEGKEPGLHIADQLNAKHYRNPKLWGNDIDSSVSSSTTNGLDITDLLPYLITSPPSPPSSSSSTSTNSTSTRIAIPDRKLIRRPWPDYIAFFATLESTLAQTVRSYGPRSESVYTECWRGFNSHWHDDARRKGDVVVWCLNRTGVENDKKGEGEKGGRKRLEMEVKKAVGEKGNIGRGGAGVQTVVGT